MAQSSVTTVVKVCINIYFNRILNTSKTITTSNKYLISVVGPTAIGKTTLSIKLANHFNTEIISADSRQFFKEMQVGTAAPTKDELEQAKHHFIHHKSILDSYNVGAFEKEALKKITQLHKTNNVIVLVGGSGLYVNAVTNGLDDFPKIDKTIREKLNKKLANEGLESLQKQLQQLDPETHEKIALKNPHRVIRALEICIGTGLPYSSFLNNKKNERSFKTITIGLTADREVIYNRINQRVDIMVKEGLLEEVKQLTSHKHLNALNTVGYKELFNYIDGEWSFEFAVSEIKKNSRRFAKRQLTWFKKQDDTLWFDYNSDFSEIIQNLKNHLEYV